MSPKAVGLLVKIALVCFILAVGGGVWYYTIGRKPKLTLSTQITHKDSTPTTHLLDQGQVLLLADGKATLYEMKSGAQKWSVDFGAVAKPVAAATPAPRPVAQATPIPAKAETPAPAVAEDKPDPLLVKRVQRHFAKLEAWSAKLSQKRTSLKTQIQIDAFNEEAAKYHEELVEAQAEAAPLHKAELAHLAATQPKTAAAKASPELSSHSDEVDETRATTAVISTGAVVWVTHGHHATGLDRTSGNTIKDIPLAGNIEKTWAGNGCLYLAATAPGGARQIVRINEADGTATALNLPASEGSRARFAPGEPGQPATPNVVPARTEFSAAGSELLQVDIRLLDKKITEHQVIAGDSVSDMEEADKKTSGGWAKDAAVMSEVLAKDAAREATGGGKERIDESTYEVILRRPFATGVAASAPVQVHGRPEVFSTPTLDLIAAGQTLIAFDRTNHQVWESKLAQPLAFADSFETADAPTSSIADSSRPCLEDAERLYLFDKAFLNTLDLKTGKPVWRLPSIGIRKLQLDGTGLLYVTSANGTADSLHIGGGTTVPLTLKVGAKDGKILLKLEKYEDCFVSGGDLYATRETRNGEDAVNQVFDKSKAPQTRFKLYKLSVKTGEPQWEWFQIRKPLQISTDHKKVSLLFADELQVIKSIAL